MKANISDETIERVAEIRGKPIVRGMDSAINECFDKLENKVVTTDEECKITKIKNMQQADCLNDECKEELEKDAS